VPADAPHLIRPTVALVDIDDNVRQTYGYAKQGTGRGYTGLNGLNDLLEERGDRAIGDGSGRGDLGSGRPGRGLRKAFRHSDWDRHHPCAGHGWNPARTASASGWTRRSPHGSSRSNGVEHC
jgi:hypothetical protein